MNAAGFPVLSMITWLPLVGCIVILSVRGDEETVASNARWTALWTSLIVFILSLVLWVRFDPTNPASSSSNTCPGCPNSMSAIEWAWTASPCCSCCCPPR